MSGVDWEGKGNHVMAGSPPPDWDKDFVFMLMIGDFPCGVVSTLDKATAWTGAGGATGHRWMHAVRMDDPQLLKGLV